MASLQIFLWLDLNGEYLSYLYPVGVRMTIHFCRIHGLGTFIRFTSEYTNLTVYPYVTDVLVSIQWVDPTSEHGVYFTDCDPLSP